MPAHRSTLPLRAALGGTLLLTVPLAAAPVRGPAGPLPATAHAARAEAHRPGPQDRADDPRPDAAALLADLLARLELGLQAEVVELGRPLVAPGGPLAADGQAIAAVARALFASGAEEQADALLEGARPEPSTAALVELERARIALERDDLERARALLQAPAGAAAPVRHPEHPDAWLLLARVYARGGRLDLAAQLARRTLELAPLHPEAAGAWHLISREAVQRKDPEAARAALERADFMRRWHDVMRARRLQIRLSPEDPLPRLGLALGWMQVERWSEAGSVLEALVAAHPDYCRAYFHLGEARRLGGDAAGALSAYEAGLGCDPEDLRLVLNRGLLRRAAGELEAALADLERVVASPQAAEPLFLGAHLALARTLRDLERPGEAEAALARYRELGGTEDL